MRSPEYLFGRLSFSVGNYEMALCRAVSGIKFNHAVVDGGGSTNKRGLRRSRETIHQTEVDQSECLGCVSERSKLAR